MSAFLDDQIVQAYEDFGPTQAFSNKAAKLVSTRMKPTMTIVEVKRLNSLVNLAADRLHKIHGESVIKKDSVIRMYKPG